MNKCVVTGGAGFIGSNLAELLVKSGYEVSIIDNFSTGRHKNIEEILSKIKFVNADISVKGSWEKEFEGANFVFHLAALADIVPSIESPTAYFDSNVTGTLNVLEASKKYSIGKFLYAASSSCYGIPNNYPTSETEEMSPQYPYALTKYLGEQLVTHWGEIYKLPYVSLRLFNVYGPKSRTSGTYGAVFGVFLAQKLSDKPLTIVGDGEQTRDFTYVSDVCNAFLSSALSSVQNQIYNVGSGCDVSVNKIADLIGGSTVNIPKRPGEPDRTCADISKIISDIDWRPKVSIESGIANLLTNIDYWREAVVWTPKTISVATKSWFKYLGDESD